MPDLNGVPIGELQLTDGPAFRGASTFGITKEVYLNEPREREARYTGHNWSSREEIWRRLDLLREREVDQCDEIQAVTQSSMSSIHMTRSAIRQAKSVTDLIYGVEICQYQKVAFRNAGDLRQCDYWFGLQCNLHALAHIIEVWLDLKDGQPDRAWIHKVDAEEYLKISRVAILASGMPAVETLGTISLITGMVESMGIVFPPLMFGSSGFSYSSARCSVCKEDISNCEHIEGCVYWGKYCTMVNLQDIQFDHFARVRNPHDRRSYFITSIGDDGSCYHVMTGNKIGRKQTITAAIGRRTLLPDISN